MEGALEDDLSNIEEAGRLLRKAAGLFEAAAEPFLRSRTLTQLAYVLVDSDPAESLKIVEQALVLIPGNNPRLVWFAETIKIDCLSESVDYIKAHWRTPASDPPFLQK